MGVLWLVGAMMPDNAIFHLWMKGCHTRKSLQAMCIQCFSEVMVLLLLVDPISQDNATREVCLQESPTQVSAGKEHTVFLRSDGSAVASGRDLHGQGRIPPLRKRMTYTQVSAGGDHTVLLQSDGTAVAVGMDSDGQCIIPSLTSRLESFSPSSKRYIPDRAAPVRSDRILQLDFQCDNDVVNLIFCTLAGQEVLHLKANGTDLAFDLYKRISREFGAWITGNLEDFGCLFWEVTQNVGQICHWKSMSFPLEMMDPLDGGIPIAILVYWRISFYPWFYQVFVSIHHVFVSSVPLECPFIGILGDFQLWVLG